MEEFQRGRRLLLIFIGLSLLISVGVIALYQVARGGQKLPAQIIRFVLTVALSVWLYRGNKAAKWIAVVLFSIAGGLAFGFIVNGIPALMAIGVVMAAVYLSFAGVLIWSPSVNGFLEWQRRKDEPHLTR